MGNAITCCSANGDNSSIKIVFWKGSTKILAGKRSAGEIMIHFPDRIVCHANSFYIGQPIPALSIEDELVEGETYFVLPIHLFTTQILMTSTLTAMASTPNRKNARFLEYPFQYIKGSDGGVVIKVSPEFLMRIISGGDEHGCKKESSGLCSTPELQKHYVQLVGSKEKTWSPKLETICEYTTRKSGCGLFGL